MRRWLVALTVPVVLPFAVTACEPGEHGCAVSWWECVNGYHSPIGFPELPIGWWDLPVDSGGGSGGGFGGR